METGAIRTHDKPNFTLICNYLIICVSDSYIFMIGKIYKQHLFFDMPTTLFDKPKTWIALFYRSDCGPRFIII